MIFKIIFSVILLIMLITLMYNTIKKYDMGVAIFATVCAVGSAIIGLFFGLALGGF